MINTITPAGSTLGAAGYAGGVGKCPMCGYCPHCGRSNPTLMNPFPPYATCQTTTPNGSAGIQTAHGGATLGGASNQ